MALKNILVAYNGSPSSKAALSLAVLMHRKYGADVTGLFAHANYGSKIRRQSWMPENITNALKEVEVETEKNIEEDFRQTAGDKIEASQLHWISRSGEVHETISRISQMYDITIIGRNDAVYSSEDQDVRPDLIALKSGRPVLVMPTSWCADRLREHAVLAWDGKRTAARALYDSMQIMETKQLVTILSVDGRPNEGTSNGITPEVALQRHGINVESVDVAREGRSIGEAILDYCEEHTAGLLVMGAYEHSFLREEVFGGVTHYVMENTKLPVLISH